MIKDKFMRQMSPEMVEDSTFDQEPEWMTDFRRDAFEKMATKQLPQIDKMDYHAWKFISTNNDDKNQEQVIDNHIEKEIANYSITTMGTKTIGMHPNDEMIQNKVICCDFKTAISKYPEIVQEYFTKNEAMQNNRLSCLESSMINNGIFIYVPKNVELKEPISVYMIENNYQTKSTFSRLIVVGDQNSKFDVVQKLGSVGSNKKVSHVNIDVYAKDDSNVQFFALDAMGEQNITYVMRHSDVGRKAKMNWMIGSFNDGNTISDVSTDLNGEGSKGNTRIVSLANGRQQQGINTRVTNYSKHSDGEISQRGAILDRAKIVFNGIGKVAHGAHGANNQQENSVLMLSDEATGDANPILLIDENDVIAGHKASIGKIDERQLYYLMSRGIKPEVAKKLVIRGFLGIILSHIPSEAIKDQMINIIEGKLANG